MASGATISILFAVPLLTAAIWIALLVHSLLFPSLRVWPVPVPAQRAIYLRTRLNRSTGLVTGLSALCLVLLGVLDFESLQLARPVHLGVGAALFITGGCLAGLGFLTLGPEISTGATPDTVQLKGP